MVQDKRCSMIELSKHLLWPFKETKNICGLTLGPHILIPATDIPFQQAQAALLICTLTLAIVPAACSLSAAVLYWILQKTTPAVELPSNVHRQAAT